MRKLYLRALPILAALTALALALGAPMKGW